MPVPDPVHILVNHRPARPTLHELQQPYPLAVAFASVELNGTLVIPACAYAEARVALPVERHPILDVLLGLPSTIVADFDLTAATQAAAVMANATGTGIARPELSAAQAVILAVSRDYPCLTARGDLLGVLDPRVYVDELP